MTLTKEEIEYGIQEAARWGVETTVEEYTRAVTPKPELRIATAGLSGLPGLPSISLPSLPTIGGGIVTGEIVNVYPSSIAPGNRIALRVDYNAFHPGIVASWITRISGRLDGATAENTNYHAFGSGNRIGETLNFNQPMPNRPIEGTITLEYVPIIGPAIGALPIILDTRKIKILLPEQIDPVTPDVPVGEKTVFPYIPSPETFDKTISETLGIPVGGDITIPGTDTKISRTYFYVGIAIAATALIYIFFIKKGK